MRILLIEDSERLRRSLARGLGKVGWAVDAAADGAAGLAFLASSTYDAVVLDLMLPEVPGLEVLRRLRARGGDAHVLILSAMDQVADRVRGLELGADDYLVKPFAFDELVARLQALVRRRYGVKSPRVVVRDVEVDTAAKRVTRGGEAVHLTPSEYALLELLVMRRGRVASKAQLLDHLYRGDADVTENVVEVLVSGLRRKLDPPGGPPVIATRRGFGYVVE